jgi:exopolyphosphatase/guanosine-5'-triphosphate,3'-diphosphate pyrophosphatase
MPLKASIDIGTNSTRLLIVDVKKDGALNPVEHHERITKLGGGMSPHRDLHPEAMNRVIAALNEYQNVIRDYDIQATHVLATSATRDARNRGALIQKIHAETGWDCRVLSGQEEAQLSFLGVISDFECENLLVCDVGGGSSEFIRSQKRDIVFAKSIDIGSGRLTRRFLHADPAQPQQVAELELFVQSAIKSNLKRDGKIEKLVAVGGTAATLALIDAGRPEQQAHKVHHYELAADKLTKIIADLSEKSIEQRRGIIGLHPRRADVILGGALIFQEILKYLQMESITVSLRDLMFGVFVEKN